MTSVASGGGTLKPTASKGSLNSSALQQKSDLWQHPFVDLFKTFRLLPVSDWKSNKRHGDVQEVFAKEIGRKAFALSGSISANNYLQMPHPNSMQKSLGLTGRYIYLQVKAPLASSPLLFHFDLKMKDRTQNIRISCSNLYKGFSTQNSFVLQMPLSLDIDRWTVVVLDLCNLLSMSSLLPPAYVIGGSYQVKSVTLCANSLIRGVFTSDNLYDFVTLPPDMRFKFSFDISRWPEHFAWLELPQDLLKQGKGRMLTEDEQKDDRATQLRAKAALRSQNQGRHMTDNEKDKMRHEIDDLIAFQQEKTTAKTQEQLTGVSKVTESGKRAKYEAMQQELNNKFGGAPHEGRQMLSPDEQMGYTTSGSPGLASEKRFEMGARGQGLSKEILQSEADLHKHYLSGQYCGIDLKRSPKLSADPVMELQHIIGYSPDKCLNLKWSKIPGENIMLFSSSGTLIAMDAETREQKRFFFGHSAPICCFDVASHGHLLASAQEGKNSLIRIWDYATARCMSIITMPVTTLKCLSFSPDSRMLASVGKDERNKELIIIWDITRIARGEKPEIIAKQTSDMNVLCLKFSPVDNTRLVSCGKENIRFWRIRETGNIRGSSVVLNAHARDTVFSSLDFEFAARAATMIGNADNSKENEALKRVYVASKHGMVFQINYQTEVLEATYRTNDSAIFSIAVNEAFCVTGSEDKFVRVWPLDFSEFYLEAKHENTVCAVDISADGLRIVCGTLYGSIGLLDKSNQNYKTLIRCHTDSILAMEYHLAYRSIITVSRDKTIRLWNIDNFDQNVEFSSPIDQPLCVAAHPSLPIFSSGFESGTMRIFDIEKTSVSDEYTQFNKPIKCMAYAPTGCLLVTVSVDGSVALHNARRGHLPIKMMHLEFAPLFVHVSFSEPITRQRIQSANMGGGQALESSSDGQQFSSRIQQMQSMSGNSSYQESDRESSHPSDQQNLQNFEGEGEGDEEDMPAMTHVTESLFGVMGDHGNSLMIYDTDSIVLRHQIAVGQVIRSFRFTHNLREVLIVTKDHRIRIYSLSRFEGVFIRELTSVHREGVSCIDLSVNGGYMITGGDDNLLKLWDSDASKTVPYYFQAFIGHIYPVTACMFSPQNPRVVYSAGQKDGIYVWRFYGDTATNYYPQPEEPEMLAIPDRNALNEASNLEQMRMLVKDYKKPKLAEHSFLMPLFQEVRTLIPNFTLERPEKFASIEEQPQHFYQQQVERLGLSYRHFVSVQESRRQEVPIKLEYTFQGMANGRKVIEPILVNGYDGFSGAHANVIWQPYYGRIIYSLNNKLIVEDAKTRSQSIYIESTSRLSCLCESNEKSKQLVAAGEGDVNEAGVAHVYVFTIVDGMRRNMFTFHHGGIQAMAFARKDRILITMSNHDENAWAIWDLDEGTQITMCQMYKDHLGPQNSIVVDPTTIDSDTELNFLTIGSAGGITEWRIEYEFPEQVSPYRPAMSAELKQTHFIDASFFVPIKKTDKLGCLITCNDGTLIVYDPEKKKFADNGQKRGSLRPEALGCIVCAFGYTVIATEKGWVLRYPIKGDNHHAPEDPDLIERIEVPGGYGITSLSMDSQNREGLVGTTEGSIYYIDFNNPENVVPLVRKLTPCMEKASTLKMVPDVTNTVMISASGEGAGVVKLYTAPNLDQIHHFQMGEQPGNEPGPVACVLMTTRAHKPKNKMSPKVWNMVVYKSGFFKLINIAKLKEDTWGNLPVQLGEEITCGSFSPQCHNFALGTSTGAIFLGHYLKDTTPDKKQSVLNRAPPQLQLKVCRIDNLVRGSLIAVTSVNMSTFTPEGKLLVSFNNGTVRMWNTFFRKSDRLRLQGTGGRELSEMGPVQFDLTDEFDMLREGRQVNEVSRSLDQSQQELQSMENDLNEQLYAGRKYPQTEAMFAAGGDSLNEYYSYCEAVQFLFVYNYHEKAIRLKITLDCFPTCLRLETYKVLAERCDIRCDQKNVSAQVAALGSKCGRVFVYQIDKGWEKSDQKANILFQTRGGCIYGEVTDLSLQETGYHLSVASSTGELYNFELAKNLQNETQQ